MEYYSENNYESNHNDNYPDDNFAPQTSDDFQTDNSDFECKDGNDNKPIPNVFALFAKSLGIFSIFCAVFSIFFGSFICGGVAIILAFLSKGYDTKMEKPAKIGLWAGFIGIVLQIATIGFSVYSILYVPEFREEFSNMYEQMYGVPLDESIDNILEQFGIENLETEGEIL